MSRVAITAEMAELIAAAIADFPVDQADDFESGALPLYADIRGVIGIRPDGTLLEWSHDGGGRDIRPVEDRHWVLIAVVAGARRYPKLRGLLSARGPDAVECQCRKIPSCISGLIWCGKCGGLGWVAEGDACDVGRMAWPRRESTVEAALGDAIIKAIAFVSYHLIPRRYSLIVLVLVVLALASFYGAFVILTGPWGGFTWNRLGLIVLGLLALKVATRGIGRRRPDRPAILRGPNFDADDPEVTALPPTSITHLSEQIKQARERQRQAQDSM
jgi:hypothetical protein